VSSSAQSDRAAQTPAATEPAARTVNTEGGNYYERITVQGNAVFVAAGAEAAAGLVALADLMQSKEVWSAAGGFRSVFESLTADIAVLADLKSLHDLLHRLYYNCYALLADIPPQALNNLRTRLELIAYQALLEDIAARAQAVAEHGRLLSQDLAWRAELPGARAGLVSALEKSDGEGLQRACARLERVLIRQPTRINARLITVARQLRLPALVATLAEILALIRPLGLQERRVSEVEAGTSALRTLQQHFDLLVTAHDGWQTVVFEAQQIGFDMGRDMAEFPLQWPPVHTQIGQLCAGVSDDWALAIRADADGLAAAIALNDLDAIRLCFAGVVSRAGLRFARLDTDLKDLCDRLLLIGEPIALITRKLL
jgi:hypothetical protein